MAFVQAKGEGEREAIYGAPKTWVHNMGADRGRREKIGSKRRRDRVKMGASGGDTELK